MALHFEHGEYQARQAQTVKALAAQGLDGLLMFQQESMYYLTGYDSFGFCFFQCLYLGVDGRVALLTRSADLRQAQHTSTVADIRIWTDAAGAKPADQLKDMLESMGARGKRLGIETNSYGLTHFNGKAVDAALAGFCNHAEASDLVKRIRDYQLQDRGINLPRPEPSSDLRGYGAGAQILADIGVRKMRIIGAPKKLHGLAGFGLEVVEYV
jgi:Xaa-Pro dipeptidase